MEALKSISKTAELLDVSHWTIRAWIAQGRLKSVKLGSRRMIPESEIVRVIAEGIGQTRDGESKQSVAQETEKGRD